MGGYAFPLGAARAAVDSISPWGGTLKAGGSGTWGRCLYLAACSLLAVLARGYHFGKEDQVLYLPFILHWQDSSLFPRDPLLTLGYARESLSWGLVDLLARLFPLEAVLLTLYLICGVLILWASYKAARAFWGRPAPAWVAVLLWMPAYAVPGVANTTFDDYFTTRILGTLFGLLALAWYFEKRRTAVAGAFLGGILAHVVSMVPLGAGIGLAHLARRRWRDLALLAASCLVGLGILSAYAAYHGFSHNPWGIYSGEWLKTVHFVDHELFPQLWPKSAWSALGLILAMFLAWIVERALRGALGEQEREALLIAGGIIAGSLIGLAGSVLGVRILVELCLFRGYLFVLFLFALMLAGPLAEAIADARWPASFAGCLMALAWTFGEWPLQTLALVCLMGLPHLPSLGRGLAWLWQTRGRLALALGLLLAAVVAWQAGSLAWGWRLDLPYVRPAAWWGTLAGGLALLVVRGVAPAFRGERLALLLPLAFALRLVLVPSPLMVDWLRDSTIFRKCYGSIVVHQVVQSAARQREGRAKEAMGALVRRTVPKDGVVVVPPDWMSFRLDALRTPYVTYKDGAPAEFDRSYAAAWLARMKAVRGLRETGTTWERDPSLPLGAEELLALRRGPGPPPSFVITKDQLQLPEAGRAGGWILYRLEPRGTAASSLRPPGGIP